MTYGELGPNLAAPRSGTVKRCDNCYRTRTLCLGTTADGVEPCKTGAALWHLTLVERELVETLHRPTTWSNMPTRPPGSNLSPTRRLVYRRPRVTLAPLSTPRAHLVAPYAPTWTTAPGSPPYLPPAALTPPRDTPRINPNHLATNHYPSERNTIGLRHTTRTLVSPR